VRRFEGKRGLVLGVANKRSIAWAIAKRLADEGAQLAFTYLPVMHDLFATRPVGLTDGLLIIGVGVLAMVILEAEKHLMRRMGVLKTR